MDNLNFENTGDRVYINIINNKSSIYGLWLTQGTTKLEFEYDIENNKFKILQGTLGQAFIKNNLDNETILNRIKEAIDNQLFMNDNSMVNTNKLDITQADITQAINKAFTPSRKIY